ncbi:MAG: glycosyltransferase [Clostridia bacterium]|nr:glycosyltransferase [Clostridia bacterium]
MKVLMINSVCGIRSTGRICTDIADLLTAQGHECKIAYGRETVPEKYQKYAVRIGSNTDVKIHAGLSRIFDSAGFHSKKATKKFLKWVEEYNPDVIHLHNLHGYYLHLGILFDYLKKANKKVVWTLHDCWAFTGHCAHFDYINCQKWQTGCFNCPQKKRYPSSLLFDHSKQNYEKKKALFTGLKDMTIVTPSKWLADLVKQSFLKEYPVKVVYNGIDLAVFKPMESDVRAQYGLVDKKIVLGVATAWANRKGLEDFITLSNKLDKTYQIVLVGLTKTEMEALPETVLGIERTNSIKELVELYTAADVFVNLTAEETLGLTNIEALACGTPVVTYRTGGSPETVDETCGVVVDRGDIEGVRKEVQRICENAPYSKIECERRAQDFDKNVRFIELIEEVYH